MSQTGQVRVEPRPTSPGGSLRRWSGPS